MIIFLAIFLTIWISVGLICKSYEMNEISSWLIGLMAALVGDWLLSKIIFYLIKFFPTTIQKPFYLAWKENLLIENSRNNAMFSYPISLFIEIELDKHFEEGGIKGAEKALFNKINDVGEALMKPIMSAIAKLDAAKQEQK
jgi:hypothetical protein